MISGACQWSTHSEQRQHPENSTGRRCSRRWILALRGAMSAMLVSTLGRGAGSE
jgi:hypothetical protein